MAASTLSTAKTVRFQPVHALAWGLLLLFSILPEIVWRSLGGEPPAWLFAVKMACAAALLLASLAWGDLKPLSGFFLTVLVVFGLEWLVPQVFSFLSFQSNIYDLPPFARQMLAVQAPRFTTGAMAAGFLWLLTRRGRYPFFLRPGQLGATAAPAPPIMDRPTSWRRLGPILGLALTSGLVVFMLVFGTPPSGEQLAGVLPLLPLVLIFAASNAFGEEMIYRASFLTTLEGAIGPRQALFSTALLFGIGHYYGVPYGLLGVAMSFVVGWIMGKAMLETRGFFWAWFIHICMDIAVFVFIAMGSITPGG
jgi:membrane protease YdiL (CAAX protease family)